MSLDPPNAGLPERCRSSRARRAFGRSVGVVAALLAVGCPRSSSDEARASTTAEAGPQANPHREAARAVLMKQCGTCHHAASPEAKKGALAIFDLKAVEFAARMNDARLDGVLRRFGDDAVKEGRAAEVRTIRAFVEAERKRLTRGPKP